MVESFFWARTWRCRTLTLQTWGTASWAEGKGVRGGLAGTGLGFVKGGLSRNQESKMGDTLQFHIEREDFGLTLHEKKHHLHVLSWVEATLLPPCVPSLSRYPDFLNFTTILVYFCGYRKMVSNRCHKLPGLFLTVLQALMGLLLEEVSFLIQKWCFSPCPHAVERLRGLSWAWIEAVLVPFTKRLLSRHPQLTQHPSPVVTTWALGFSRRTEGTNIQAIGCMQSFSTPLLSYLSLVQNPPWLTS